MKVVCQMKFKDNRYTKWYHSIISRAKSEKRVKTYHRWRSEHDGEYYESHHIIPRAAGGPDNPDNLVLLTYREHVICHRLLTYMFEENSDIWCKMVFAFNMMLSATKNHHGRVIIQTNTRQLERVKKLSVAMRLTTTGYRHTEESRDKMSKSHTGKRLSELTKDRIRESVKSRATDPASKQRRRDGQRNRTYTDEEMALKKAIASARMKEVWAKRKAGEIPMPVQPPIIRTEPISEKIPKELKTPEEISKATSRAMKQVWAVRRALGTTKLARRADAKTCADTKWCNNGIVNKRLPLSQINELGSEWILGRK